MAIPVSRAARHRLGTDGALFDAAGRLRVQDIRQARELVRRLGPAGGEGGGTTALGAADLAALSLLGQISETLLERQLEQQPELLARVLGDLDRALGPDEVDRALTLFAMEFLPPLLPAVAPQEAGGRPGAGLAGRRIRLLRELVLYWVMSGNPALGPLAVLFDDRSLRQGSAYPRLIDLLGDSLGSPAGPGAGGPLGLLLEVLRTAPGSLAEQLRALGERWGSFLPELRDEIAANLDLLAEEHAPRFAPGPGPSELPVYPPPRAAQDEIAGSGPEEERFSPDRSWMPRVVMLAKNSHVWLDQLSRHYGRPVARLDEIPERELDLLAERGFTALWLIGLWERSHVSRRIKQMCGNPEAVASAYSLFDYRIADDLGGEEALAVLGERAGRRGIRLAADMVPNHMGIDSRWLVEHPERFLSVPRPPFPAYSFDGPDLSTDPRVGIYLEDHYYDRSDAAVVFRRVDRATGEERFIYHGNDGTSMPWNDTAQLDYLQPETRTAVVEAILQVAARFPIIRFDAAMTLAKRHYHRLWFPPRGAAGAIPSRSEHSLTREELDERMPEEFWRQLVDEVAERAPDTLLLAEAFWLMEGYFVRTLGMHRVYNSAFMNMLRDRENGKYRRLLSETLAYDPRILERYVNFMSNPDERTAVEQFGRHDRYFGTCTLLCTLPGLPMFAHGQVEGLAEKYGMEYRRAYFEEEPDPQLIAAHERLIFPLLGRRELFAGVDGFRLYDLRDAAGSLVEDVFAYSNGRGEERALVLFNNRPTPAEGRLRLAHPVLPPGADEPMVDELAAVLDLGDGAGRWCRFRDHVRDVEHLAPCTEIWRQGLAVRLEPFQYAVYLSFAEIRDEDGSWGRLARRLAGRGVPSLEGERRWLLQEPVVTAFGALFQAPFLDELRAALTSSAAGTERLGASTAGLDELAARSADLLGRPAAGPTASAQARRRLAALRRLAAPASEDAPWPPAVTAHLGAALGGRAGMIEGLWAWLVEELLRAVGGEEGGALDPWQPAAHADEELRRHLADDDLAHRLRRVLTIVRRLGWATPDDAASSAPENGWIGAWLADEGVASFLGLRREGDEEYLRLSALVELLDWRLVCAALAAELAGDPTTGARRRDLLAWWGEVRKVQAEIARPGRLGGAPVVPDSHDPAAAEPTTEEGRIDPERR